MMDTQMSDSGVAPCDAVVRAKWPRWKVWLAYGVLVLVAVGSVWVIDGHVLVATPR